MYRLPFILILNGLLASQLLAAEAESSSFCRNWTTPERIGILPSLINEASGLVSSVLQDKMIWLNDSIQEGALHVTSPSGKLLHTFFLPGFTAYDSEALASYKCGDQLCLWLADIGDNKTRREIIRLSTVEVQTEPEYKAKILSRHKLRYPDGPHDAEAIVTLPNSNTYIVTKNYSIESNSSGPAKVYRLPKLNPKSSKTQTLIFVGEIPIPQILSSDIALGHAVTDAAFDSERKVIGLLTYTALIEFPLSVWLELDKKSSWNKRVDYQLVPIKNLTQQETLTYLYTPNRAVWSSERVFSAAPIFSMTCLDSKE